MISRKALVGCTLLASCQLFTEHDVAQCKTDADCEARGGDFAGSVCKQEVCVGATACLGKIAWEAEDPKEMLHTRLLFVDSGLKPVAGAKAVVCAQLDPNCERPSEPTVSDANGYALVPVPRAFRGQIRVNEPPPGFDDTFMKTSLVTYPPLVVDETENTPVPPYAALRLFSRFELDALLALSGKGATVPGRGHVFGVVSDCNIRPLRGAKVTATPPDPDRLLFLGDSNDTPSPAQTETAGSAIFAFINVQAGVVTVEASYRGQRWSTIQAITSPDVITNFAMPASPH